MSKAKGKDKKNENNSAYVNSNTVKLSSSNNRSERYWNKISP